MGEESEVFSVTDRPMERRGFIRIPFNTEAEVEAGDHRIKSRNGIDLSMSGMRIATNEAVPPAGTPCRARITLRAGHDSALIEAGGEIVRSAAGSLAVQFNELDLDSYHHLRQIILNNTDDPERAEQEFTAHWGIRPAP